ncbi:MAG: hypothetical protein U1D69_11115, partial [Polynucleobacter sp.]|nr:hypothetical protein [Polynucleobacter sp.]
GPRQAYKVLLHILLEQRCAEEGVDWAARAITRFPDDYSFFNLQGAFLNMAGRRKEALAAFNAAIRLRPAEPAAHVNKGHCLNEMGDGAAAELLFTKLIRKQPRSAPLHRALARALSLQGKFKEAERRLRLALTLDSRDVDIWLDLSAAASDRADRDTALSVLDRAVATLPGEGRLAHARAVMLRVAGQNLQVAAFLRENLDRFGQEAWLHCELARALAASEPDAATVHHRKAVELAPANRDYRLALAEHLMRTPGDEEGRHLDEAFGILTTCHLPPKPELLDSRVRTQILTRVADFSGCAMAGGFSELGRMWAQSGLHTALLDQFARVSCDNDRHELVVQHRLWGDKILEKAALNPIKRSPKITRHRSRVRIGFMSSDLRNNPVTYFTWPLFEHVNRDKFEIYCYSFYRAGPASPLQEKLTSMVDQFRWTPSISDRDAAQMIADDDVDILFELGGSTFMNKLDVLAWRPASLCASWLGYPHSAGLSTIDYLLVDPYLNPADTSLLIEQPLVMPRSWIVMSDRAFPDQHRIDPVAPLRRKGYVTFGTANSTYKYNPAMLRCWARVLAKVPRSRFLFVRPEAGSEVFQCNIKAIFAAEGVDGDRIEFRPVRGRHMPHYNDIDIALDTFPQTGGTTTCEALWMGVPTVTVVGPALFERLSYSILSNAGLSDLCARTVNQFVDIAVSLAEDSNRLQILRHGLRDQLRASPLGMASQFCDDFYALVERTVKESCRAIPARHGRE